MQLPDVELHEAATLTDAAALLRRFDPHARLLAGGTDLLVDLKAARVSYKHLISLGGVPELRGIVQTDEGLRIGALTTVAELCRCPLVGGGFGPLGEAARRIASPPIRNVATVGGNIVSAVPCADLPPVLLVMHATVHVWSPRGERVVPLEALFVGPRRTVLAPDEVLTAVSVPFPPAGSGAAYERFGLREGNAIAVASVAAGLRLDPDGVVADARVALGAVAPVPKLVEKAASLLVGHAPDDDRFHETARMLMVAAEPISDVRGSAEFRRELVGVLAHRALHKALDRARENAS